MSSQFDSKFDLLEPETEKDHVMRHCWFLPLSRVPWAGEVSIELVNVSAIRGYADTIFVLPSSAAARRMSHIFDHLNRSLTNCEITLSYSFMPTRQT